MSSYDHDDARLARTYDQISDYQFAGGRHLVDLLGIAVGARVLDLGCGTGRLTRYIAERTGACGTVVGVDPLPERIALARQSAPKLRFEVGKAENLAQFDDSSFDYVCINAVFHWIEDKPKALAEMRRVLREGGRIGCATLAKELRLRGTVASTVAAVLAQSPYLAQLQASSVEVMSRHLTTTEVITLVGEQELDLVELHVRRIIRCFERGEDIVEFANASSFGNFIRMVPEALHESLRTDLNTAFDRLRGPGGIETQQYGLIFIAERPARIRSPQSDFR